MTNDSNGEIEYVTSDSLETTPSQFIPRDDRLTDEELFKLVTEQSLQTARRLGLYGEGLASIVFVKVLQDGKLLGHPNPRAYCLTVIRNAAVDLCRTRARERRRLEELWEERAGQCDGSVETTSVPESEPIESAETPPLKELVTKLRGVHWGKSDRQPYLMLDARILLATQLLSLSDNELCHIGETLHQQRTRIEYIEAIMPWSAQTKSLSIGEPPMTIQVAWEMLAQLIVDSAAYRHATKSQRKQLTKATLSTVSVVTCLRQKWLGLKANTWTTNCIRAWNTVCEQYPEITAELKPHMRSKKNG